MQLMFFIGFSSSGISTSPTNVQAQKVSLQFYGTAEQTVKLNTGKSYVRITVPNDVIWYSSGVTCYDMMLKQNCTMQTGPNSFTVFLSQDLLAGKQFQYRLDGAINNPDSEQPTTSFKIETSTGEQISTGLIITATRGSMKKFLLSPQSQIVGDSTNLEVRWRAEHNIPKGGFVLLQFPKWNPSNPIASNQKSYIQGSEKCTPLAVLTLGISCDFSQDQLVLSGVAPAQQLASGIELAFQVSGFKNPIDTNFVYGFKIQTAIKSNTGVFYVIDEATASLSVSEFATLSQARLFVQDSMIIGSGIIQAVDKMQLDFFLPVPLNAGCIVNVILPKQYSLDYINEVSTLKAFGFYKQYKVADGSLLLDTQKNSFKINACAAYVENDLIATIEIDSLKQYNYESPSDSVIIQIENSLGNPIAQIESGVTFTPKRGSMGVTSTSSNQIVQEPTMISFTFKPQHEIYISDDPQMVIEFPAEVQISSVQCIVNQIFVNGASNSSPVQCTRFNQSLTVKQFLIADYIPTEDSYFQFTIGQVTNPISVQSVTGLKITLMAFGTFAIDQYQGGITWNVVVGSFQSGKVVADSYVAFQQDVTYTITFSPQHSIPQNGYIDVYIPAQIFIPDKSYTQSSCRALANTGFPTTQITCEFITSSTAEYTVLRILQAFRRTAGQGKASYVFVLPGIQNPVYTQKTSSFKFFSYTNNGSQIDVYENDVSIQMLENAKLQTVQVTLGNYDNAAHTNYTFTMVPSIPITRTNFILMTFPSQITLPTNSSDFNCTSSFTALLSSVMCSYDPNVTTPNTVRVDLKFAENVKTISPLDRFAFTMNNIQNPSTMKPTDSIIVNVNDPQGIPINSMKEGVTVTTNNSFIVKKASVLSSSPNPGRASNFEITFYAEHTIKSGGGILIVYPPQITAMQSNQTVSVQIQIQSLTINPKILQIQQEPSARAILVYNVIQGNQTYVPTGDNPIKITLVGLRNPFTNVPTDSFSVQTFDTYSEQGQLNFYFIDKKANDLVIFSKCNYPCKNCNADQADICTECYEDSDLPFLQLGVCVKECATSRYYNTQLKFCDACDHTCLQCSGTKTSCSKCGVEDFLYLNQKDQTCLKVCPDGMLEDSGKNLCVNCNENCKTCENTVDACASCNQAGQWPYFFHDNCINACPPKISVLVGNQCVECHSSCKTCAGQPTSCTSCEPYMKFDPSKGTCAEMCEFETQIYVPDLVDQTQSGTCEFCNPTCSKCAGTVNTCTLCKPGYVLNLDFTCQKTCNNSDGTPASDQTAIQNVCFECAEPCDSCSDSISMCTSCHNEYLLFQASSCVQYCPKKWIPNESKTKCVWEGLSCPDNFDINKAGDGCIPKQFDCKPGYTINKERSACIPNPGSPVPFPFILASIFLSFLVLGSYIKDKFATKVLTNLIALVGQFEMIMYSLMVIFAYTQSQWVIMLITIAGIIGLVVANIIWVCWYKQQILNDEAFQKWLHFFPNTKRAMPVFCLLLNFKTCKMFYSGFYGLESTMAKFGDQQTFYRVMRTTTYFSWVFCYLPIFVADIVIFIKVKWGFQLLILAIETAILQTISIILTIIEFRKGYSKLLSPPGESYAQFKQGKEMKVMGVDEDDDYEEGIPDFEEETLIRSRLKVEERETELRRKAFSQILSQVGVTFENHNSTDQEKKTWKLQQDLQACVSNFDQKRLKYRRAFSLSDGSDKESWVCDGDREETGMHLDDSPQLGRRYSYPLSPRCLAVIPENQLFQKQIADIKQANEAFLIDNVYTEVATRPLVIPRVKVKTVSRRTQTYLRELLQVDAEELHESDMEVLMEEEAEIQADFAHSLINNVIDGISNHSEDQPQVEAIKEEPIQKKRVFKAKKEIPDFELNDIMGQFEIDELGNFIIMRGEGGELMDKMERLVNRRGYLVDRFGNVINNQGNIIFKGVELDVDDEIPAPFGFEKRKKNILKLFDDNKFTIENMPEQPGQMDETFEVIDEENLNRELQSIRERSQMHEDAKDEIKAEVRQGNLNVQDLDASRSGQDSPGANLSLENLDQVIEKVTKKKVPQKKDKLKGNKGGKKKNKNGLNNMPPKRIKQGDLTEMFPTIGVENEEQRRLARLAGAIGGLASQLANNTRQQTSGQLNTYQDRAHQRSYFEEQLDMVKQEQLNEILNDQDEIDLTVEQQRSMLQDRPNSNYSLLGGSTAHRKNMSMERVGTANAPNRQTYGNRGGSRGAKRGSNLQKVYGNIVDLIGFEEQHITDMGQPRGKSPGLDQLQRRVGSGKPQQRNDNVENIYMNASKQKYGKGVIKSDLNPFRPTLNRFADDPAELNVDTTMNGEHQGKDISLMIADNLDRMQRDYLQGGHGQLIAQQSQIQFQGNRPQVGTMHNTLRQTNSELGNKGDFLFSGTGVINPAHLNPIVVQPRMNPFGGSQPNSRLAGAQSQKHSHMDPIIRGNWVDRDSNV